MSREYDEWTSRRTGHEHDVMEFTDVLATMPFAVALVTQTQAVLT